MNPSTCDKCDPFCDCPKCETPEPPREEGEAEWVASTLRGYAIYRKANTAGGHTYYSDAIDGGVMLYDTCLVSEEELLVAMALERERRRNEREARR